MAYKSEQNIDESDRDRLMGHNPTFKSLIDKNDMQAIHEIFEKIATNKLRAILEWQRNHFHGITMAALQIHAAAISAHNSELLAERQGLLDELERRTGEIAALNTEVGELQVELCLANMVISSSVFPR